MVVFFVLNTLVVIAMVLFRQHDHGALHERHLAGHLPGRRARSRSSRRGCSSAAAEMFRAFIASAAMIALLLISGAIGLYPNLLISTTDPAYNLTVINAASADNTLAVTLIVAVIGMPFVLLYTAGVYYFFRGKVDRRRATATRHAVGRIATDARRATARASPDGRLLAYVPAARRLLAAAVAWRVRSPPSCVIAAAWLLSLVIAAVFLDGADARRPSCRSSSCWWLLGRRPRGAACSAGEVARAAGRRAASSAACATT